MKRRDREEGRRKRGGDRERREEGRIDMKIA